MEKAYLIVYNMKSDNNYEILEQELKSYKKWWHHLNQAWIIISEETPFQIWKKIEDKIDRRNNLLIIEVKKNAEGWLPREAWDWIKENLGD